MFLPEKSHRQRSLAGYSPWGRKEPDTTERSTHTQKDKSRQAGERHRGTLNAISHSRKSVWKGYIHANLNHRCCDLTPVRTEIIRKARPKCWLGCGEREPWDTAASVLPHAWPLGRVRLSVTPWTEVPRLLCPWDSPGKNTGVGCHFLLQGIFPIQGLNPNLLCPLHCRWILCPLRLSHCWWEWKLVHPLWTMENSTVVPQKIKDGITTQSSSSTPGDGQTLVMSGFGCRPQQ